MTDEEMAEDYEEKAECVEINDYGQKVYGSMNIEQAFLDGLKTGRPKWHDLRKDPHDLPKHCRYGTRTSEYVLAKFKSSNTGVCYFDFDLLGWFANGYLEQLKNIIAWCEVPKYTEE